MGLEQLSSQIRVVAKAREVAANLTQRKVDAYAKWQAETWFKTLLDDLYFASQQQTDAEATLRELTLKAYDETGSKNPAVGVGIREVTTFSYDSADAFKWAKEHSLCLKLDTDSFKKQIKATPLPFVTATTEPQATIAQDLPE